MKQSLGLVSLVVREYDEALAFFVGTLGFELIEDSPQPGKRWVVVAPRGSASRLLLARAKNAEEESRIGNQTGGRVFLFLYTDDIERDYRAFKSKGVEFVRAPSDQPYGTVAVFKDLYGNSWDLVQPKPGTDPGFTGIRRDEQEPGSVPGFVLHIFRAPAKAARTQAVESVEAVAGRGLRGDRYFEKKKRHPGDEVTLIESENIEAFTRATGLALAPGSPRRNIVTRGVRLNDLVGKRFRVGAALLEGVELCEPCRIFAKETHPEALDFFRGKGGLRTRILEGGTIRVGDGIDANPSPALRRILVTGSAGHLGEALVRTLRAAGHEVVSLDILPSHFTDKVASITDREAVRASMRGVNAVLHAASLHKPHLATHSAQDFIDVNVTGTLVLLEEALAAGASTFVYTSTTSAFGRALQPPPDAPAAWITEEVTPIPKNMYGATKTAAEDLCGAFHGKGGMSCVVLRTSRFFPEEDDRKAIRDGYEDGNTKANEFLYRRVELEDVVTAHLAALERAADVDFARYIISATTPFTPEDLAELRADAPRVLKRHFPQYEEVYGRRGWRMFPSVDRVYVNEKARRELGWQPKYDFARILASLQDGDDPRSPLARAVGAKGYHETTFEGMPFPVQAE